MNATKVGCAEEARCKRKEDKSSFEQKKIKSSLLNAEKKMNAREINYFFKQASPPRKELNLLPCGPKPNTLHFTLHFEI